MLHDSGWCEIYAVERDETNPSARPVLRRKAAQPFAELTVGLQRFYAAAQVGKRADRLIEIWRDNTVSTRDICKIGDVFYLIQQTAATTDQDGLLVTRLTLEESDGNVWEGTVYGTDDQT